MDFPCPKCAYVFKSIDESLQGRPATCEVCGHDFIIPFIDSKLLLEWAECADWDEIEEGMSNRIAGGHDARTVDTFLKIFEKKRFEEEWRIRRLQSDNLGSLRERRWQRSEKKVLRQRSLERLHDIEVFKETIVETFTAQGFDAEILKHRRRNGIDVNIFNKNGNKWGVARCKIPAEGACVSPRHIRDFAGAYMMSGAEKGFLFTTGKFSRTAEKIALKFEWLKTYDGPQLADYVRSTKEDVIEP